MDVSTSRGVAPRADTCDSGPVTSLPWAAACVLACGIVLQAQDPSPAPHPGLVRVQTGTPEARADWERRLASMARTGALKIREQRAGADSVVRDEWLVQLHKGVPVEGAEVWRRFDGAAMSEAEGVIYEKIAVDPVPKLTRPEAREAVAALSPGSAGPSRDPELVVLPTPDGRYALTYRSVVFDGSTLVTHYLDASTGAVLLSETAPPMPAAR